MTAPHDHDALVRPQVDARQGMAQRQFAELYGGAVVMTTYLKIALLATLALALGVLGLAYRTQRQAAQVKPLVIRIDDVGRAQAVAVGARDYVPQPPELKYFLVQFTQLHFGRRRATVKEAFAQSLYFLDAPLADATITAAQRSGEIEHFLTSADDEIEIRVKNVTLQELATPPYKAAVDFDRVYLAPGTHQPRKMETFVAQITFIRRDPVPNALIPLNPLGLTITYLRTDQAFP